MKKLIIFIMICALTISLCSCGETSANNDYSLSKQFAIIKSYDGGLFGTSYYMLRDKITNVIYLYTSGGSHATMCPYYITIDNKPELAIYGVNWNG